MKRRKYPIKIGDCIDCGSPIIARNSGDIKSNRICCSRSCSAKVKNRNRVWTEYSRRKLSESQKGKLKGIKWSKERRIKLSQSISGENHWNWKGGITAIHFKERNNYRMKEWRRRVFKRDDYRCRECGDKNGNGHNVILNAHHLKRWSKYPGQRYKLRNGMTLCLPCHEQTDNYRGAVN